MAFTGQEPGGGSYPDLWRRLQRVGLNADEARSYLVLLGHPQFKALELAARARVPRQKIYEVLECLVEKGFARVVLERTKLFSAVEPDLALPAFLDRKRRLAEQELAQATQCSSKLVEDLKAAYSGGVGGRGALEFLHIIAEPAQSAAQYRRLLGEVKGEYLEFSRSPYAVGVLDEELVRQAGLRGVSCRVLVDPAALDARRIRRLQVALASAGVQVRLAAPLPLKLALFDRCRGLIALLDPVVTRPAWTSLLFDHPGFGEAMRALFESHWAASQEPQQDADEA